jgi:hypothetical protein
MSLSRAFLINELEHLEMRFHPDGLQDQQAMEYIRAAIQMLKAKPAARKQSLGRAVEEQFPRKAS